MLHALIELHIYQVLADKLPLRIIQDDVEADELPEETNCSFVNQRHFYYSGQVALASGSRATGSRNSSCSKTQAFRWRYRLSETETQRYAEPQRSRTSRWGF